MKMEHKMEEAQIIFSFQKVIVLNFVKKLIFLMDVRSWPLMVYVLRTVDILLKETEKAHTNVIIAKVNKKHDDSTSGYITHCL